MSASGMPPTDAGAIGSHVDMIHHLAAQAGVDGILTVSYAPANGGAMHTQRFGVGDARPMTETIVALAAQTGLNIWAPWAVFRKDLPRGSKGGEADVVAVLALVGDLDADKGKAGRGLPIPSPYVLETSRGNFQPVFPLARALTAAEAKPIAVALSNAIDADSRTKDTSGLWRIPGTLNWPTESKLERGRSPTPQLVSVQSPWTGELIEPELLWEKVKAFANGEQRSSGGGTASGDFNDLPAGLRKLIAGAPYPGEDQSETAASVFAQLFRRGWSDADIEAVVECHPGGIGRRYADGKDLAADIRRTRNKFESDADASKSKAHDAAPAIVATEFVWRDPAAIPRRQWLFGTTLARKFSAAKFAPTGAGKTSFAVAQALSLTTGRDLLGMTPHERCKVWYWNGEDPLEEIERRIAAVCLYYNISPDEFLGRLFIDSGRDQKIVIAQQTRDGAVIAYPVVEALISAIKQNGIDVVMIDPFISSHRVTESDNNAMDLVAKEWADIADKTNTAIELTHHTRKTYGAEVTAEDGRGAVALLAAVRSAPVLNKMAKDVGEKFGVNHREFFKFIDGKNNLTKPPEEERWFQIVSQPIGNGHPNALIETGDYVGVVKPWTPPDLTASVTACDFTKAAMEIRKAKWRENPQAARWVGRAIAAALGLNVENKADAMRIKAMLRMWLAAGTLRVVDGEDEKRNVRKFVEVADHVDD